MKSKEVLDVAVRAGELLLKSGAEIYRVEDTILRICRAYGMEVECFVLLTGIFLSAEDEDKETITIIKMIKGHTIDLQRIELVNSFSRGLQYKTQTYEESRKILEDISSRKRYGFAVRLFCAGATAFVYAVLFKGGFGEGIAAFIISFLVFLLKEKISEKGILKFFEFFASGLLTGALSLWAVNLFPDLNIYKIVIGAIMILVPGMAITNGIKDALYGDTVSSLYRLTEAVFIAIAVGSGVGIALALGFQLV